MSLHKKRILITGAAGFIGSHLAEVILNQYDDCEVVALDNFNYGLRENIHNIAKEAGNRLNVVKGDINDQQFIFPLIKKIDILVHLAAEPFIPHCYSNPENFVSSNVIGSMTLLKGCINKNLKKFIYVSTSEVYGTAKNIPVDEEHPTRPHSTYAATKLAAENLVFTFSKEYGLPIVIVRPFNTFGPRDSHPRIIPEIISQLYRSNKLLLGNVTASRDFTYVTDIADGIMGAMEVDEAIGEIINLASGKEIQIADLVKVISEVMEVPDYKIEECSHKKRRFDVERLCADISKAYDILNWKPKTPLREGLKLTVSWYIDNGAQWRWEMPDYPYPYSREYFQR